jgi:hypothetical protein
MPLAQAKDKIFGDLAVPSSRCVGPFGSYGSNANSLGMISSWVSFTPIYTNVPRTITTLQFIVTSGATSTGTPLIQFAMYNCRSNQLAPSTQIANTLTTGIDPTTTGVKTTTFSPTWVLPKGISFFGMNIRATVSNNTCSVRGYDGSGRHGSFIGNIGSGWDGTSPTTQFSQAGIPLIIAGENTALSSDYSSATIDFSNTGADRTDTAYVGVFLK